MTLKIAGQAVELWRYPIASIGGERLSTVTLTSAGVVGDRNYGLIDLADGSPARPDRSLRWRKSLHLRAEQPDEGLPIVTFPDDVSMRLDDQRTNEALSEFFGFAVAVAAFEHAPSASNLPTTRHLHTHFPVHLLTTSSLDCVQRFDPAAAISARRFRPNIVIASQDEGFVEDQWIGFRLGLGSAELLAQERTTRCGVTMSSQPGLNEDPGILRNILRHNKRNLGVYCAVGQAGQVRVGDSVHLKAEPV